jgi:tellurium resistance protein TerD
MVDDILDTRFEGKKVELKGSHVQIGDDINLMKIEPSLRNVHVGMGWDLNNFDADVIDLDVSVFLTGKDGKTRVDEDFVFYNNPETLGGGIKHTGDSRTGAGDGDDECIVIDLQSVPFDVQKLVFVISIYRGEEKQQRVGQVDNAYFRVLNADTMAEMARFDLAGVMADKTETAMIVASLNREGPKWHFTPVAEFVEGGLGEVAKRYGCLITQS